MLGSSVLKNWLVCNFIRISSASSLSHHKRKHDQSTIHKIPQNTPTPFPHPYHLRKAQLHHWETQNHHIIIHKQRTPEDNGIAPVSKSISKFKIIYINNFWLNFDNNFHSLNSYFLSLIVHLIMSISSKLVVCFVLE